MVAGLSETVGVHHLSCCFVTQDSGLTARSAVRFLKKTCSKKNKNALLNVGGR